MFKIPLPLTPIHILTIDMGYRLAHRPRPGCRKGRPGGHAAAAALAAPAALELAHTPARLLVLGSDRSNRRYGKGLRESCCFSRLVPREHSTGGQQRQYGITKRGDRYLRTLLIHGARSALLCADGKEDRILRWALKFAERRGFNVAAVWPWPTSWRALPGRFWPMGGSSAELRGRGRLTAGDRLVARVY